MEQLALTISEACAAARIGRTSLYAAIKSGELVAAKYGRKTLIRVDDLRAWLAHLPKIAANSAATERPTANARSAHVLAGGRGLNPQTLPACNRACPHAQKFFSPAGVFPVL